MQVTASLFPIVPADEPDTLNPAAIYFTGLEKQEN
jgi:hypothetical protein